MSDSSPPQLSSWFTGGRFAAILGLLVAAMFLPVITGTQTFVFRDYGLFTYPVAHYFRESFWRGEVPLWNPLSDCGIPFLAQWNTMVLYPPSLIYLLLPLTWGLAFFCLLHLYFGGLGMYFLARKWTGCSFAAAVAGVAFTFNGISLNALMWLSNLAALAWMPWIILLVEPAWRNGGRKVIPAALAGALQMLSGAPEIVLFTWVILFGMMTAQLSGGRAGGSKWAEWLARFTVVVVLVTALSAAQLLPFLELIHNSDRGGDFDGSMWSMPGVGWANFIVPLFHCFISPAQVYFQSEQNWTSSYYLGSTILALAILGVIRSKRRRVWFLGATALAGMVLALGQNGYVYTGIQKVFPMITSMRYPIKFVVLTGFAIPLIAAFAVGDLLQLNREKREPMRHTFLRLGAIWGILAIAIIGFDRLWPEFDRPVGWIAWLWLRPELDKAWIITLLSALTSGAFLYLGALIIWKLLHAVEERRRLIFGVLLLLLVWADVWTHTPPQNPTVNNVIYEKEMLVVQSETAEPKPIHSDLIPRPSPGMSRAMLNVKSLDGLHRTSISDPFDGLAALRLGLYDNCNLLEDLAKVDGFFSIYLKYDREIQPYLFASATGVRTGMADFLGVSQVSSEASSLNWTARPTFLPLVTAGQRPILIDGTRTMQALGDPSFDPRRMVFLPAAVKPELRATNETSANITGYRFAAQQIEFDVKAATPAMVVVAQCYYPAWKATVDGQPVPVWRANHAYQAIQTPVGTHHVVFSYVDKRFTTGAALSLTTLIICCGIQIWLVRRKPMGNR